MSTAHAPDGFHQKVTVVSSDTSVPSLSSLPPAFHHPAATSVPRQQATSATADADGAAEAPVPRRADSLPSPLFRRQSSESCESSTPLPLPLTSRSRASSSSLSDLFAGGAGRPRESQHCIASVLYKNRATQALTTKNDTPPGSGRATPEDVNSEVRALVKALAREEQATLANAANTIANLALRKELQGQIIEHLMERMLFLVLNTPFRDVHRFVALSFCRLAQKAEQVAALVVYKDFYPALSQLAGSPSGTIWRQAARTVALVTIHAPAPAEVVDIVGVGCLRKLATADQLEFQSDALRALLRLSETRIACQIVEDRYWDALLRIATESKIPIIPQLACEVLCNVCEQDGTSLVLCDESLAGVAALAEKPQLPPGTLKVVTRLQTLLSDAAAGMSRAPTKTSPEAATASDAARSSEAAALTSKVEHLSTS